MGVDTVADLRDLDPRPARASLTVVGERIIHELRLDADHPGNGVLIPRLITGGEATGHRAAFAPGRHDLPVSGVIGVQTGPPGYFIQTASRIRNGRQSG
jgi:hypothetical protein